MKKRIAALLLLVAVLCVGSNTEKCMDGVGIQAVVVEAEASGVEHIWDNMDVDSSGTFHPGVVSDESKVKEPSEILDQYKSLVMLFTGILTITCIALLIFNISKLSMAGSNDQARRNAIIGIMVSGIALSLFGGAGIVIGFFWNAFMG